MKTTTHALQNSALGLAILAVISLTSVTVHAVNVDNVHPRIFFYADSLEAIRERAIGGSNHEIFEMYSSYVDRLPTDEVGNMHDFAAMYQLTGNPSYATTAIDLALQAVDDGGAGLCSGQGPLLGRMSYLVLTYDWCYDLMTPSQRQIIQDCMMSGVDFIPDGFHQAYNDYSWQYKLVMVHDTSHDAEIQQALDVTVEYLREEVIPCYDELKPNGAQDSYFGKYYSLMFTFMDVLKHAAHLDLTQECVAMQNSWSFWTAIYRPDRKMRRLTDKWNPTCVVPVVYFAWQGSRLGSRRAQALANMLVNDGQYSEETALCLLLWYNPDLPADPLVPEDFDWYDPYGWYIGRTGWDFSDASTDITIFFNNKPRMDAHQGGLHYDIIRGPDDLITKNSYYEGDIDLHFSPWLTQAQAFNTILVYDPDEDFGTYTHDTYGNEPTQRPMPNAGQQGHCDRSGASARWPHCTWISDTGYCGWMEEPQTIVVRDSDGIPVATRTRIVADATAAYSSAKVSKVTRTLQWQRPDWFFVKDQVVLEKDGLPVKSLIHCVERPEIGVTPTTIRGDWSKGGVFSAPVNRTIVLNNGDSSARVYVLQAAAGGTPSNELRIIGGASRQNLNWRQHEVSNDFGYVSDPNDISYEFFIEQTGRNYMPSDSKRVDGHDVEARHTPTHLAGDWRVEITVNNGRDTVDISYLVHVTERDAPIADVSVELLDDTLWATATDGNETLVFEVCDNCQGMQHQ